MTTHVVIVDDHRVVAEGFVRILEADASFAIDAVVGSGEELFAHLRAHDVPDVCILDLSMPGIGGGEALKVLRHEYPKIKTLVVSAAAQPEIAARCLREGAFGFLSKFHSSEMFLEAVQATARAERYIDKELFGDVVRFLASPTTADGPVGELSAREFEVMRRIAIGMSVKDISEDMNLNAKTVSTYRTRLLKKLNLRTNAEVTAFCLRHNLVSIETP
jgi:two-component system invasion response regulator UvrY